MLYPQRAGRRGTRKGVDVMWNGRKNLALASVGALAMVGGSTWLIVGLAGSVSPQLVPISATVPVVASEVTTTTVPVVTSSSRSPIILNVVAQPTIPGSPVAGSQGDSGSSHTETAHEVLVQPPTSVPVPTAAVVPAAPETAQDTVVDVVPTDVRVGPDETGYIVTDDSADAAGGPETAIMHVDPVSGEPFFEGPGGVVAGNRIPSRIAMAYGIPDAYDRDVSSDEINFGQIGGELAPVQFFREASPDTRLLSCVQQDATGPQTFEASSVLDADARLADGRCTLVHS